MTLSSSKYLKYQVKVCYKFLKHFWVKFSEHLVEMWHDQVLENYSYQICAYGPIWSINMSRHNTMTYWYFSSRWLIGLKRLLFFHVLSTFNFGALNKLKAKNFKQQWKNDGIYISFNTLSATFTFNFRIFINRFKFHFLSSHFPAQHV